MEQAKTPDAALKRRLLKNHRRHFGDSVMGFRVTLTAKDTWRVYDYETCGYSDWVCRPRKKRMFCIGFKSQDGERVSINTIGSFTTLSDDDEREAA